MGGAVESLWFGVPTVAIPQAVDQFLNAAKLADLGAGVQLPAEQLTGESLRAAVEAATRNAGRAQELSREVRSAGGVTIAADAVERLCRSGAAQQAG
jgi:UDP:flavonoid glycosyltransferase YjiC (YdhE family)